MKSLMNSIAGVFAVLVMLPGPVLAQTAGSFTTSPASLSFSSTPQGTQSAFQQITVRNTSPGSLQLTGIRTTGSATSDFIVAHSCSQTLPKDAACAIAVSFKPTATGTRSASIEIRSSSVTKLVALKGTGAAAPKPAVTLTPTSITFAGTATGTSSSAQTVTLKNTGTGALQLTAILVTGTHAADFSVSHGCSATVAANGTCSISVVFRPTATGSRTASVEIRSNAATRSLSLKGTGAPPPTPSVTLSPTSLTFVSTAAGATSSAQAVSLRNTGAGLLQLSSIVVTGNHATDFIASHNCSSTVVAGGTCTINVAFRPTASGSRTASLEIRSNVTTRLMTLKGTGAATAAPVVTLTPTSVTFSSTATGSTSAAQTITLRNSGAGTLQVATITVAGANATDFVATNNCGAPVAANGTCTITVNFKPTAAGARSASIDVRSNAAPRSVTLKGTSVAPQTFTVSAKSEGPGTVNPASRSVVAGQTTTFELKPQSGYAAKATGCGGTLTSTSSSYTYTTGAISAACDVAVTFYPVSITVSGTLDVTDGVLIDTDTNDPTQRVTADNNTCSASQVLVAPVTVGGYVTEVSTGKAGDRFAASTDKFDAYRATLAAGSVVELTTAAFNPNGVSPGVLHLGLLSSDCKVYLATATEDLAVKSVTVPRTAAYYVVVMASRGSSSYVVRIVPPPATTSSIPESNDFPVPEFIDNEVLVTKGSDSGLKGFFDRGSMGLSASGVAARGSIRQGGPESIEVRRRKFLTELTTYARSLSPGVADVEDHGDVALVRVDRRTAMTAIRAQAAGSPTRSPFSRAPKTVRDTRTLTEAFGARYGSEKLRAYVEMSEVSQHIATTIGAKRGEIHSVLSPHNIGDPGASLQKWHYDGINLPQALSLLSTQQQSDVVVAVIDSGVMLQHPDLAPRLVAGYDFIDADELDGNGPDSNPDDPGAVDYGEVDFHGTHVAGTVAAVANNGLGGAGVAGTLSGVRVMPLRVCGQRGCPGIAIINAIKYAAGQTVLGVKATRRADVINLSLGGSGSCPQAYAEAIAAARAANIVVIASAGNGYERGNPSNSPANCEGVVAVGAVGPDGRRSTYSQVQSYVDIAAPGGESSLSSRFPQSMIYSSWGSGTLRGTTDTRKPTYTDIQGTSMAAPHVAGVAALMRSVWPQMRPTDFDSALAAGKITTKLPVASAQKTNEFGYGLVDAAKSVGLALQSVSGGATRSYLTPDPGSIEFGLTGTTQGLVIRKFGSITVRDVTPLVSAPWLSIQRTGTAASSDTYSLTVSRTGLAPGAYAVAVRVTDSAGTTTDVWVSMTVPAPTVVSQSAVPVYVLVWDSVTKKTIAFTQVEAVTATRKAFSFKADTSTNGYLLIAGSDANNDRIICDVGELCSAWPITKELSSIPSESDTTAASLKVGFENRSVAQITNASVGGIWIGNAFGAEYIAFSSETGVLQTIDDTTDETTWGTLRSNGRAITGNYTVAADGKVAGTGALRGSIDERLGFKADFAFTSPSGVVNTSVGVFEFIDVYKRPSSFARIKGDWADLEYGLSYSIDDAGKLVLKDTLTGCTGNGSVGLFDTRFNMYALRFVLSGCSSGYAYFNGSNITGLATLDYDDNETAPPMYFLGQQRVGSEAWGVVTVATRKK